MTQYIEGAHSAIKHAIETSGSLTKFFNSLDRWLCLHHEERLLQYENKSVNIDPLLTLDDKNRLKPLLGMVAQFALNKIKHELLKVTMYKACLCELQIEARYMNFSDKQQKSTLLQRLDDILVVPELKLSEIKLSEKIIKKDNKPKILLNSQIPVDDVDQIYNPKSDRNCGFRALACMEVYQNWLGYNVDLLKQILESQALSCSSSLWFLSPDCAQLAADTFSVPIAIFDED
ncbi:10809_t:CDS:2, partial [Cetraspora pellucida]